MACKGGQDEPGTAWDYALLGLAMVGSFPFIAANVMVFLHRKRRYFRAQGGAPLILTSSIAGLVWICAAFVANLHFPRKGFLLYCRLWSFWLELTFGYWLWLACQLTRFCHLLYLCQNTTTAFSAKCWTLLCFLVFWIPGLVLTVIADATHGSVPDGIGHVCANCELRMEWRLCTYIILPSLYYVILIILLFCSKSTKDYMMAIERSHTSEYSLIMVFVLYLLYGATFLSESDRKIPGRLFLTFLVCCVVFINFWVRLGWPLYLCVCKKEAGIDNFEEELQCCGAHCLDKLSSATGTSLAMGRSSSSLQDDDWILRAIDAARSEAAECKERINQLERRKAALSVMVKQLGDSACPGKAALSSSALHEDRNWCSPRLSN